MHRTKLLITGFEPFADFAVNPSGEAAAAVGAEFGGDVIARVLPVDILRAREQLSELLTGFQPKACLSMGLAAGDVFRIERTARKVAQFAHLPGNPSHGGTFDWDGVRDTLTRLGAPWRFSDDCGRYVCESTYWTLLEHASRTGFPREAGFLHVPAVSSNAPLERTIEIVRQIISDLLRGSTRSHGGSFNG